MFGDLLGSQGYDFASKRETGPKTINAMRKEELAQTMDPEKLKIREWVSDDGASQTVGMASNCKTQGCSAGNGSLIDIICNKVPWVIWLLQPMVAVVVI